MSKKSKKRDEQESPAIKFDYIKSNYFRVIHADGAVGGPTPTGNIQMNIWSQRLPIPRQTVHSVVVDEGGEVHIGAESHSDQRDAIVREVETGVVLDLASAIQLRDWLHRQIEITIERMPDAKQDQEEEP